MNTSSTRRSESTRYVHAVSRMVVDAKGHADDPRTDEWKHPPTCARKMLVRKPRETTEDLPKC
jgi:hypothetical protein